MLSAKTFLIMEEKKILPRISDWEEKYPLHPVIKVTWRAGALQKDAEICRGRRTGIRKTKFLFKAFLNSASLFYLGTSALSEGRRLGLEILKLPTEKNITGKVQIYLSSHTSGGCPWSGITANPGDGNPLPTDQTTVWKKPSHPHSPTMKSFNPV